MEKANLISFSLHRIEQSSVFVPATDSLYRIEQSMVIVRGLASG